MQLKTAFFFKKNQRNTKCSLGLYFLQEGSLYDTDLTRNNKHMHQTSKLIVLASSFRSAPTTYWFFSNACSNFSSWLGLKAVRILFGFRNGSKNSGKWGPRIIRRNIIYYIGIIVIRKSSLFMYWDGLSISSSSSNRADSAAPPFFLLSQFYNWTWPIKAAVGQENGLQTVLNLGPFHL